MNKETLNHNEFNMEQPFPEEKQHTTIETKQEKQENYENIPESSPSEDNDTSNIEQAKRLYLNENKTKKSNFKFIKYLAILLALAVLGTSAGIGYRIGGAYFVDKKVAVQVSTSALNGTMQEASSVPEQAGLGAKIAEKYEPAIVSILQSEQGYFESSEHVIGTGVVFSEDKDYIYIVSNQHVVYDNRGGRIYERQNPLYVAFDDNNKAEIEVLGSDTLSDLAVLKVSKENIGQEYLDTLVPVTFADSDKVKVGEWVIAIGNPLGFVDTTTFGIVSALNRKMNLDVDFIQIDAAINSGNSGGATFNMKGEVIGINTIKIKDTGVEGLGFAVSSNDVKNVISQIIETGKVKRAYLGIQGSSVTEAQSKEYEIPIGARVEAVFKDTGAHIAGILPGDVITKIDGEKIYKMEDLIKIVKTKKVGDRVKLTIFRAGHEELELSPMLKERGDFEQ